MRTKLAQLRANKSPLLQSYLHTVNPDTYTPQCALCLSHTHDTNYLVTAVKYHTTPLVCKKKPIEATEVIQEWKSRLTSLRD